MLRPPKQHKHVLLAGKGSWACRTCRSARHVDGDVGVSTQETAISLADRGDQRDVAFAVFSRVFVSDEGNDCFYFLLVRSEDGYGSEREFLGDYDAAPGRADVQFVVEDG